MDNTPMLKNGKITEVQAREVSRIRIASNEIAHWPNRFDPQRSVTYWTAFIQEGLWAPYIGRPVYVPDCT
jgi:hypothetical protein